VTAHPALHKLEAEAHRPRGPPGCVIPGLTDDGTTDDVLAEQVVRTHLRGEKSTDPTCNSIRWPIEAAIHG
jgi:hypothetical protein